MKPFVKFRSKQSRRRQARRFSPWQSALERLEDRTLLAAPTVDNPIANQTATFGAPFNFVIPSDTFADSDTAASALTYSASGVPAWITFTAATRTFSGTPTSPTNAGISNITVTVSDGMDTANDAFTLAVANAVPSFTKGANLTVSEGAIAQTVPNWATNISQGLNESGQTVEFLVSNDNPGLFSIAPAISTTGTLNYTPAANQNGSATVTVFIHDNGGTASGGVDTSASQTFTITITPVNDVPSFTVGAPQTALEDSGAQTVSNFVTAISAGTNDSGQTVDFLVSNNNPSLFGTQPTISASGTLTYTLAANANGTATVTVAIHDNGGTANGGVDTSANQTFTITITSVNDAPGFTKGPDQTVLEGVGAQTVTNWASNIIAGSGETIGAVPPAQTVEFQVSNNNTGLFSVQPSVSPTGTLTYTPAANVNGSATVTVLIRDNGGTANGGVEVSAAQTFTITITAVNSEPSFVIPPVPDRHQTVFEDSGAQSVSNFATAISAGTNDSGQTVEFLVSNNNSSLFSAQPSISSTGTLTYTPAANANGTATVTVTIRDNGGTANGGDDTGNTETFTITITGVNDAPSFTKGPDQTVLEDAGAQTVPNWATNISAGTDDAGQTVDFQVTNNNNSLFLVQPSISPTGTLTYTLAANQNGTATVTVLIHDNGGTANGGVEISAAQTFTITVTSVNDAPSFTVGPDLNVLINSPAQTFLNFATSISAGPNEMQTVDFIVSNDNQGLFTTQPAIAANGTLTFTPAAGAFGAAIVSVQIHDNGGIANGGVDASVAQTFTINIGAFNKGTPVSNANPKYTAPAGAKVRAVVVNGELIVQFNGVPQQFYEPGLIATLTIIGGSKNDEIDLTGLMDDLGGTLYGNLINVVIRAGAGNDRIVGSFADDSIDAGSGNDTLSGGFGDDILIGNAGTDLLTETADEDMLLTNTTLTGGLGDDRLLTIEKAMLTGGDGDNEIDASGFTKGAVTLLGGAGNDTLTGGTKNDLILGQDGDDSLTGGAGNDTVLGGFGNDELFGGLGNDVLIGGFDDDTIDGGDGRDTVVGGNGGAARGGEGVADAGDDLSANPVSEINEAFKKLFAFE